MEKMQLKYERLSLKNITHQHIFLPPPESTDKQITDYRKTD
jgi:hypothetical protein